MAGRPIKKTHLCVASSIRALPENGKPPARPADVYCATITISISVIG